MLSLRCDCSTDRHIYASFSLTSMGHINIVDMVVQASAQASNHSMYVVGVLCAETCAVMPTLLLPMLARLKLA